MLGRREVQNTAHPRSYVSALTGEGYRIGRGITEKLTRQRKLERTTEETYEEVEMKDRDRGEMEESIENTEIASTTGKEEGNEIGRPLPTKSKPL